MPPPLHHHGSHGPAATTHRPEKPRAGWRRLGLILLALAASIAEAAPLERSFWVHASLGAFTQRNYFGPDFPATPLPGRDEVQRAARVLTDTCAANRLYLIYHRELPLAEARQLLHWWREACPASVELVPALVLRMYDRAKTPVFAADDLAAFADFFRDDLHARHLAIYDIAVREQPADAMAVLTRRFPDGLIRLGLQPGEALGAPFVAGVADTWSALCHGRDNERDWQQPGFGAATLRQWVAARNPGALPVAWNLVTVAWDYAATERGGYPGYDDAEKNMPLPAGRNRSAVQLIRETAQTGRLAGFSSDLYILQENSRPATHDGRSGSFYECLKRGESYRGYYGAPFQEIAILYRQLRDRGE